MEKKDIIEDRAFVEIHMMQSIDGKATGDFFRKPDCWAGMKDYHQLFPELKTQAFAIGRVTMEEINKDKPDLSKYKDKEIIEHKDFVAPREKDANYYFAIYDSKGTIGYQANTKHTTAWANDGTKVISQFIEVLSDQVSNEYLHYLQDLKVSYIFAGKDKVDIRTSLVKLKKLFGIDKMLLQGGPIIDGAFLDADCIVSYNCFPFFKIQGAPS